MKHVVTFLIVLIVGYSTYAQDRITGKAFATRSEVIAQHGMAAIGRRTV
jgi:gamma-glutamyltranspeptidase/glutathione hydrolase